MCHFQMTLHVTSEPKNFRGNPNQYGFYGDDTQGYTYTCEMTFFIF